MEYVHGTLVLPVDNTAWWFHDLSVPPSFQLREFCTAAWVVRKLAHMAKDPLHQKRRGPRILQGNIVRYGVQIAQRWFSPDYFNHRDMRCLACACVSIRPSSTALSPRAIPSSSPIRRCSNS